MAEGRPGLPERIEAIEAGYEFFLAYAAQGVSGGPGTKTAGQLREFLSGMEAGLDGLAEAFRDAAADGAGADDPWAGALEVLERDAAAALGMVRLVASRDEISSQVIDNLNANIHLRAVLTDLFLLDELLG